MAKKKEIQTKEVSKKADAKKNVGAVKKAKKGPGAGSAKAGKKTAQQTTKEAIFQQKRKFPIVGIGASAGGLEAFETFFKAMPPNCNMAFILVAHLDPTHISILPELVQKRTPMKVFQIEDGMKVEPNQVYIIPPNSDLAILNSSLQLMKQGLPRGINMPIDTFLRSLAQDQGANAICIILSGTGTDGTLGLKEIKGETGMVMVQDEESAKYDGMPRSAIATGMADFVLPPEKMPAQLIKYAKHAASRLSTKFTVGEKKVTSALQKIFILLRARTGHDFSLYKKNTIYRRIERRMHIHQINTISDYVNYLQDSEHEVSILFKELLIGVTSFFRDSDAFEALKKKILPNVLQAKPEESVVRVWVPGCSSGEEAYSIAMVLQECMAALKRHFDIQIFGTDIDEEAITIARAGLYPASISVDVGPERLKRFFTREENAYRVKKQIREMLVFAPQNIIKDPPFTKLDLLCCRNLLIYLGPELQKKLFPVFHYSLKPDGILFLGSSETIGQATDLFYLVDKKWKIFRRRMTAHAAHPVLEFPTPPLIVDMPERKVPEAVRKAEETDILQLVETILEQSDTPPSVIIDDAANIIYIHGRTGRYLEPAVGKASINILAMARPGLKKELAVAIRKVATQMQEVVYNGITVQEIGGSITIDLIVRPIIQHDATHGLMMVIFDETPKAAKKPKREKAKKIKEVEQLEQDLQYTKESLQTTIEELETSNEELKSTNEELQSTNEELQSTNEELETSKEELQSLNEESITVNVELQGRIDELSKTNDDMKNLLDATQIATIFLDVDMGVRRFTPRVNELIPLTNADIGRPISHLASELKDVKLKEYAGQVLNDLIVQETEVESNSGQCYRMRVRPYRTVSNVIDGVVITFEDISEFKKIEAALRQTMEMRRLAAVVRDSNDAITVQDFAGNITAWNRGAEKMYGYTEAEALNMNILDIVPPEKKEETMAFIAKLEEKEEEVEPFETQRRTKDGRIIEVWLTVTKLEDEEGGQRFIATTERNISKVKRSA